MIDKYEQAKVVTNAQSLIDALKVQEKQFRAMAVRYARSLEKNEDRMLAFQYNVCERIYEKAEELEDQCSEVFESLQMYLRMRAEFERAVKAAIKQGFVK